MIIFYHEFDSVSGGGAVLIINLIKGLISEGKEVLLVNFENGRMKKELEHVDASKLQIINGDIISIRKLANAISQNDIIISTHFYSVFRYFISANPKFLFYCVGHLQLYEANRLKIFNYLSLTRKLVNYLSLKKGILYIEQNALNETVRMLKLKSFNFPIVPIPVKSPLENLYLLKPKKNKGSISFTYVGRAVNTKIYPIQKVISDLENIIGEGEINFYIITDDASLFKSALGMGKTKVNIEFYENLSQADLDNFLLSHADIHFAQATSALEGAKLGIPTILLDFSFKSFPEGYLYNFVHQTDSSYIGTDANNMEIFKGLSMQEIIIIANAQLRLEQLSIKSYNYVRNHHDLNGIILRLIKHINETEVRMKNLRPFLLRYWF